MTDSEKFSATENDAAAMSLAIAICDALVEANQIDAAALLKRLAVAEASLLGQQYPKAAGIVGVVRAALSSPEAVAQRRHLATILTTPAQGKTQ